MQLISGDVEAGDLLTLTHGGKTVAILAPSSNTAEICAKLAAAWNDSPARDWNLSLAVDMETHVELRDRSANAAVCAPIARIERHAECFTR